MKHLAVPDELTERLTAPGTPAGVVLGWLAEHPLVRRIDAAVIARATGEHLSRIAWGLFLLRKLGRLPRQATLAPAPQLSNALLPTPSLSDRQGLDKVRPASAPTPTASDPEVSPRVSESWRQSPTSAVETAAAWLVEILAERPLRASEIRARAAQVGIAWRTAQRARSLVGVEARRLGNGVGVWMCPGQSLFSMSYRGIPPPSIQRRSTS
jgi:hypothetical protein